MFLRYAVKGRALGSRCPGGLSWEVLVPASLVSERPLQEGAAAVVGRP